MCATTHCKTLVLLRYTSHAKPAKIRGLFWRKRQIPGEKTIAVSTKKNVQMFIVMRMNWRGEGSLKWLNQRTGNSFRSRMNGCSIISPFSSVQTAATYTIGFMKLSCRSIPNWLNTKWVSELPMSTESSNAFDFYLPWYFDQSTSFLEHRAFRWWPENIQGLKVGSVSSTFQSHRNTNCDGCQQIYLALLHCILSNEMKNYTKSNIQHTIALLLTSCTNRF